MKKWMALCLCCALMLCASTALANSWGLTGDLYSAVSADSCWNDYTTYGMQSGDAAVMKSRYHNALMLLDGGKLQVYTAAVWQPDDDRGVPRIAGGDGDSLLLGWGEEEFCFVRRDGALRLQWARAGEIDVHYGINGYIASADGETVRMQRDFRLQEFNVSLFPRTLEEARGLNLMYAALDSGSDVLGWAEDGKALGRLHTGLGKGSAAVYFAPFGDSAWRAAGGKAAVGLKGDVWLLRLMTNADGDSYACVRYEVSQRTQRIGWVAADKLGFEGCTYAADDFISVNVYAAADTYLTDDPLCSQFKQLIIPEGAQLTCMGMLNDDYAYVSAEMRDGRLADGGHIVWGFVPLRDLTAEAQPLRQDVMDALAGCWWYEAGGSMSYDCLILCADGTFIGNMGTMNFSDNADSVRGTWYVTEYDGARNLYWNSPAYEITFILDSGAVNRKGLTVGTDEFSLTNREGGGGYCRVPDEEITDEMRNRPAGENG